MPPVVAFAVANPVVASAIVTAGAQVAGAKMNSGAAKNAAKVQAQAADRALAEQKRIFDIRQAQMAPYMEASKAALGELGAWKSPNLPAAYGATGSAPTGAPAPSYGLSSLGQPLPSSPVPTPSAGGLVMIEAPTGQRAYLRPDQAELAIQRGARRVQ